MEEDIIEEEAPEDSGDEEFLLGGSDEDEDELGGRASSRRERDEARARKSRAARERESARPFGDWLFEAMEAQEPVAGGWVDGRAAEASSAEGVSGEGSAPGSGRRRGSGRSAGSGSRDPYGASSASGGASGVMAGLSGSAHEAQRVGSSPGGMLQTPGGLPPLPTSGRTRRARRAEGSLRELSDSELDEMLESGGSGLAGRKRGCSGGRERGATAAAAAPLAPCQRASYLSSRAPPQRSRAPHRACSVCGGAGRYACPRCGSRSCSVRCTNIHLETWCLKMIA